MNKHCVVLLSGGVDSALCLAIAIKRFGKSRVQALGITYANPKRLQEPLSAFKIANYYGVDIKFILTELPNADNPFTTLLHGRNAVLLSLASAWAKSINAKYIFFGANSNDYAIYKDCRQEFIDSMNIVNTNTDVDVKIVAPLIDLNKKEIIVIADELKVPLNLTWSCYKDGQVECGECNSCRLNLQARQEVLNMSDKNDILSKMQNLFKSQLHHS